MPIPQNNTQSTRTNGLIQSIKRIALSALVVVTFLAYAIRDQSNPDALNTAAALPTDNPTDSASRIAQVPTETSAPLTVTDVPTDLPNAIPTNVPATATHVPQIIQVNHTLPTDIPTATL